MDVVLSCLVCVNLLQSNRKVIRSGGVRMVGTLNNSNDPRVVCM